jgi:hypothetical protein
LSEPTLVDPGTTGTTNTANLTFTRLGQTEEPALAPKISGESDPRMFTEEDINKAREQEKSKLYKRLEMQQSEIEKLQAEFKTRAEAEEQKRREAQEVEERVAQEQKQQAEAEMSAKDLLAQKEKEWQQQLQSVQQQVEQEKALRERESQFAELMDYRGQVQAQYQDRVAPQLLDLIQGNTPEEIVQAAEDMAARTDQMVAQFEQAQQTMRQQAPTARVTAPMSGENSAATKSFTPDDIKSMSMADYVKNRRSLLGNGAGGPKNRGFFG